jgi:glycosyltransferase involved in cell wall biosynthesis
VVPYRFGGGVKIKALDAMAHGCPVVATTVGAEGLRIERGRHLLVEDDAERFAAAVSSLLESEELQTRLGQAGRAHVEATFSWSAKTAGLVAVIDGLRCRQSDRDSCTRPRGNARSSELRSEGFMPSVGRSADT